MYVVVEILKCFALLSACLNVITKLLAEAGLATVAGEINVDCCTVSNISFLGWILESADNYSKGVVLRLIYRLGENPWQPRQAPTYMLGGRPYTSLHIYIYVLRVPS